MKDRYEEALERARKKLEEVVMPETVAANLLYDIFPELAESEDERIRKWIASYIHRGVFNEEEHPKALRAIEWLEKQKEQKDYQKLYEDIAKSEWFKKAYVGKSLGEEEKEDQKPVDYNEYKMLIDGAREDGKIKGRKEVIDHPDEYGLTKQKPAEWSDTDNIGWDEAFACVTRAEKAAKNEEELQNAVTAEKWLKEIKFKYYVHPVKQEWSEEDTEMYINVASSLRGYACGLENEEHKRHIQKGLDWLENRFKSLRPQPRWKPSEEQISALEKAIIRVHSDDEIPILCELRQQLKKLM